MSNRNAEGYLELTPIMNVTGGKAASGAQNWHVPLYPARLESLGIAVADKGGPAHRLLGALFPNDVPQLQPTGRMRPMVLGAVAGVLCAYSKLLFRILTTKMAPLLRSRRQQKQQLLMTNLYLRGQDRVGMSFFALGQGRLKTISNIAIYHAYSMMLNLLGSSQVLDIVNTVTENP